MESVLLKANLVNLSTSQYWLKIDEEKGMSDREGHGHKAILYESHFPPLRHSFRQRHHCIHRLINHIYTQRPNTQSLSFAPRQKPMPKGVEITLENVNFAYMFQWVKPRGSILYKGLGAMLLLPIK